MKISEFITKFNGDIGEDIELWIDRLESAEAIFDGEEKITKMMPLLLTGDAYFVWKSLDQEQQASLTEIKSSLRQTFGLTKLQAWQQLKDLTLEPMASVDAYAARIERLYKTVSNGEKVPETVITAAFLDGIPPNVREQVVLTHGEKLSKREVLAATKSVLSQQVGLHNVFMGCGRSNAANNNSYKFNKFNKVDRINTSNYNRSKICSCCSRVGHLQKDCNVRCYICGLNGHYKNNCPQNSGNESAEASKSNQ